MTTQLFETLERSPVLVQYYGFDQKNWENMFHLTINLAKRYQCSFHLIDLGYVVERYITWTTLLPSVKPFFAHAYQRDPKITSILGCLGAGFSCSTFRECNDCCLNVPRLSGLTDLSRDIILDNPFKLESDMKNCNKIGVKITTFMCKSELDRIKQHWPDAELQIAIIVNPQLCSHQLTMSKLAAHPDQVEELLEYVKQLDLNLVGLLCYHGTHYKAVSNWSDVPRMASDLIDKIKTYGFEIKILNLGDGFDYIDQENEPGDWMTFQEDLSSLNNRLTEYFPSSRGIKIIAQPCRFFTQKCELFAFKVMGRRIREITDSEDPTTDDKGKEKRLVLIVENSQYMSFNFHTGRGNNFPNFWYNSEGNLTNLALLRDGTEMIATIYGFTCDSLDIITDDIPIPSSIAVGDYLIWVHRGAYGTCLMSQFNGMKPPRFFHVMKKEVLDKFMDLCNIKEKKDLPFNTMELNK